MSSLPKPRRTPPPHLWTAVFICLIPACTDAAGEGAIYGQAERAARVAYADATVVIEWNQLAQELAYGEDQFRTFKGQRALAMMNLAIHDALNTIAPKYERHVFRG